MTVSEPLAWPFLASMEILKAEEVVGTLVPLVVGTLVPLVVDGTSGVRSEWPAPAAYTVL